MLQPNSMLPLTNVEIWRVFLISGRRLKWIRTFVFVDLSKDSNIFYTDSEGELQEKVIALFKEKYRVQCRKINKEHYSVIFPSTEEYLKFKNYALELAKPFYIFESDVLSVIRIQNTYDGIMELYPLNSFDITSVLAKILGLRTDH